jgi:hypothetical protein
MTVEDEKDIRTDDMERPAVLAGVALPFNDASDVIVPSSRVIPQETDIFRAPISL